MEETFERSRADFIGRVMAKMGIGLFVTFLTAYLTASSETMLSFIYGSRFTILILMLAELGLVIYLTARINKMSFIQAKLAYYAYAILNGITLSSIFLAYNITSIYTAFLAASAMFIVTGLIGITTKKDLSGIGQFMMLMLIGIIVSSIINIFIGSSGFDIIISIIGIITFSGLTAYDMQKLKAIHHNAYNFDEEVIEKYSIIGALQLYLDFVNLFLYFLRIFGKRR